MSLTEDVKAVYLHVLYVYLSELCTNPTNDKDMERRQLAHHIKKLDDGSDYLLTRSMLPLILVLVILGAIYGKLIYVMSHTYNLNQLFKLSNKK